MTESTETTTSSHQKSFLPPLPPFHHACRSPPSICFFLFLGFSDEIKIGLLWKFPAGGCRTACPFAPVWKKQGIELQMWWRPLLIDISPARRAHFLCHSSFAGHRSAMCPFVRAVTCAARTDGHIHLLKSWHANFGNLFCVTGKCANGLVQTGALPCDENRTYSSVQEGPLRRALDSSAVMKSDLRRLKVRSDSVHSSSK